MAHFALLDENNIVVQVTVVDNKDIGYSNFPESEAIGQRYLKSIGLEGKWLQTSYNGNFRKYYAGAGYSYNVAKDIFLPPQPFPSWVISENNEWIAPIPLPKEKGFFLWNEENKAWDKTENVNGCCGEYIDDTPEIKVDGNPGLQKN